MILHSDLPVLENTGGWTIVIGGQDTLYPAKAVGAYWTAIAPQAGLRIIEGAGRLLSMTHPGAVVGALTEDAAISDPAIPYS